MKAKAKKRVVSRKKSTKATKSKSVSTKKTTRVSKSKKPVVNSRKANKQPCSKYVSKGVKKDGNAPFKKNNKHGFQKGKSGNPKGRPKLGSTKLDKLHTAISYYQMGVKPNPKDPVGQFIKQAFKNDTVLIALMKKLYPDLKSIEQITVASDSMTEKEAADIKKEIAKRFETKQ